MGRHSAFFLALSAMFAAAAPAPAAERTAATIACDDGSNEARPRSDTEILGQRLIREKRYLEAIEVFSCIVDGQPTAFQGYRGRAEAKLMLGRFADAFADYARLSAHVIPLHPDTLEVINKAYDARLRRDPADLAALTGASFARWTAYDNAAAAPLFARLSELDPDNVYGTLFGASNRLFLGLDVENAQAGLEKAIALAPRDPHVRYIVADAYTYALPDLGRAFDEATLALQWGLDTPRVHAILVNAYLASLDLANAARHLQRHFDLVTTQTVRVALPLAPATAQTIALAPGRTYDFAVPVAAGESLSIRTLSPDSEIADSIVVLLAPNGTPLAGNDDFDDFFAGFDWLAPANGTYTLRVTSFEGVGTGLLVVSRQ